MQSQINCLGSDPSWRSEFSGFLLFHKLEFSRRCESNTHFNSFVNMATNNCKNTTHIRIRIRIRKQNQHEHELAECPLAFLSSSSHILRSLSLCSTCFLCFSISSFLSIESNLVAPSSLVIHFTFVLLFFTVNLRNLSIFFVDLN